MDRSMGWLADGRGQVIDRGRIDARPALRPRTAGQIGAA
jgi:hypothetical protein